MKRAIVIGINEFAGLGPSATLRGCVNDADDWAQFLIEERAYEPGWIVKLVDAAATKANVIREVELATKLADAGEIDEIFIQLSSHGTQVKDDNGDEADGFDEAFVFSDVKQAGGKWEGLIRDDEWNTLLSKISPAVSVECVFDTCHSASGLRVLEFDEFSPKPRFFALPGERAAPSMTSQMKKKIKEKRPMFQKDGDEKRILWSGCRADQTSADAHINDRFNGAFTRGFIECHTSLDVELRTLKGTLAMVQWRESVYKLLTKWMVENEFSQVPQLEWKATTRE